VRTLRTFLVNVFTRHLATKFLALMLATILFVVVRQRNEGSWNLDELTLQFHLEQGLEKSYVLLDSSARLINIQLRGLPTRVGPIAIPLQESKTKPYTLTRSFLERFATQSSFEITARLLEEILGEEVEVVRIKPVLVRFDRLARRSMEVVYPPEDEAKLVVADDVPYRAAGTNPKRLKVRFNCPDRVEIAGPRSAFESDEISLFVLLPDLNAILRKTRSDREELTVPAPIRQVDWKRSGIDPRLLRYVTVRTDKPLTAEQFQADLQVLFDVSEQKREMDRKLEIRLLRKNVGGIDISKWKVGGAGVMTWDEFKAGRGKVTLRMPQTLAGDKELLDRLVMVVDLASVEPAAAGVTELQAPVYLGLRGRSTPVLAEKLKRISIADDKNDYVLFQLKQ